MSEEMLRLDIYAPIASFKDSQFSGVVNGLPLPPPSTLRGMLAGVVGQIDYAPDIAYCFRAQGSGIDLETYHPLSLESSKKIYRGQTPFAKGGATIKERPFLASVDLSIWLRGEDAQRVAHYIRRPVWGLRLGRSQDIITHVSSTWVDVVTQDAFQLGSSVIPALYSNQGNSIAALRLPSRISPQRQVTYERFIWDKYGRSTEQIQGEHGAQVDPEKGLVWFV